MGSQHNRSIKNHTRIEHYCLNLFLNIFYLYFAFKYKTYKYSVENHLLYPTIYPIDNTGSHFKWKTNEQIQNQISRYNHKVNIYIFKYQILKQYSLIKQRYDSAGLWLSL